MGARRGVCGRKRYARGRLIKCRTTAVTVCARAPLKATTLLVIVMAVQTPPPPPPPGLETVSAITMSIISIIIGYVYTWAARRCFRRISAIAIGRPTYAISISRQFPRPSSRVSFTSRKLLNRRTLRVTKFYFYILHKYYINMYIISLIRPFSA